MKKIVEITLLALLLTSCGQERMSDADAMGINPTAETATPAPEVEPATSKIVSDQVIPTFLEDFPSEVTSCDCSLFLEDDANDLFFVFDPNGGIGIIGLNGQKEVLQRGASLSQANARYDSYLHENDNYKVQSSLTKEKPTGDEGGLFSGKMKVTNKRSGIKAEFNVQGTCSC